MKKAISFLLAIILLFLSCNEKEPTAPTEDQPTEVLAEATIGPSGGELQTDDFVIRVPQGAFDSENQLSLTIDSEVTPPSTNLLKHVYALEGIPTIYHKTIKVIIKLDSATEDTIALAIGHDYKDPTTGISELCHKYFSAIDSSNYLICDLPPNINVPMSKILKVEDTISSKMIIWAKGNIRFYRYGYFQIAIGKDESGFLSSSSVVILDDMFKEFNNLLGYTPEDIKSKSKISYPFKLHLNYTTNIDIARPSRLCFYTRDLAIDPTNIQNNIAVGFNLQIIQNKLTSGNFPLVIRDFGHYLYMLYPLALFTNDYEKSEQYWLHHSIASWFEEKFPQNDNHIPLDFINHFDAPFSGLNFSGTNKPEEVEGHGIGMSVLLKYLVSINGDAIIKTIFNNLNNNSNATDAILKAVSDENIWLPNFFKDYIRGLIYNISGEKFLSIIPKTKDRLFVVENITDTLHYFNDSFNDLSAKLYRINIVNNEVRSNGTLTFKIGPSSLNLDYVKAIIFGLEDNQLIYLGEGTNFNFSNLQQYNNLVACVVNSANEPPYTETLDIDFDVSVKTIPELKYNWGEVHFAADGVYDSNPINAYASFA